MEEVGGHDGEDGGVGVAHVLAHRGNNTLIHFPPLLPLKYPLHNLPPLNPPHSHLHFPVLPPGLIAVRSS